MVLSKNEQRRAFIVVAILYGVWHTTSEWSKLLLPFIQWDTTPSVTTFQLGVLNTVSNAFVLIGTFIFGHLLDTIGVKIAAIVATFFTGVYYMVCSQAHTFLTFLIIAPLRTVFQLSQICESFISSLTDETERMRVIMRLGIPMGIAIVAGPWFGAKLIEFFDLREAHMIAGVVEIIICLPLILLALPEPRLPSSRRPRMIRLSDYNELLRIPSIRTTLLLRFLLDGPYQAYDILSRQYIITQYLTEASDLAYLFVVIGATTVIANTILIKWLQRFFRPLQLLQLALGFLALSYFLIGIANDFKQMLILMPLQVVGMSIAYAELSAQVTKPIERQNYGKAIGLSQATQLLAATLTPIIGGYFVSEYDFSMWCNIAAAVSVLTAILLYFVGGYMNTAAPRLPTKDDYSK